LRFPLAEELEGVGEGAFMPVAEFALRNDMVVVVVEVEDAVGRVRGWLLPGQGYLLSAVECAASS